ncbi:MAG TPA: hypothetical protein VGG48_08835 [Rhizomicrobium sp.]|jgi:hypothetical protein
MSVDDIEKAIPKLSPAERARLLKMLAEMDAAEWDRQIEEDIKSGKFDELADRALAEHAAGKTRLL